MTRSNTKADYVLAAIQEDSFPEISDWLCEQGDTPIAYDALKTYFLQQYSPSPAARAWNICTLQDLTNTNRLEQRTALICKELAPFNVDVAALSETRLPEEGNIREAGTGYTIFWKGKALEEPRIHGVGYAIYSQLVQQHNFAPKAISERLMTLQIPIMRDRHLTLISVYASTITSTDDNKAAFYTQLDPHHPGSARQ
ncbi:uncharacterized protein [Palaemon carinicauda]|uniref:uncharacterized protein n=1 Tax=Palaemon carinicauda TaxID=392227 RepID=UPI0035B5A24E